MCIKILFSNFTLHLLTRFILSRIFAYFSTIQKLFAGKRYDFHNNYARILVNNPLFHAYGTSISILVALTHGSALILPAPHFTPELSLRALRDENANIVYGTPTSKWIFFYCLLKTQSLFLCFNNYFNFYAQLRN